MGLQRTTGWVTTDGTKFTGLGEARDHEARFQVGLIVDRELHNEGLEKADVTAFIVDNWHKLLSAMPSEGGDPL